jgi:hypothetical protein
MSKKSSKKPERGAKSAANKPAARKSRERMTPIERAAQKVQQETFAMLQTEVAALHQTSLYVMDQQGYLPPLYGGDYLEDDSELLPIWGTTTDDAEAVLGTLMLRVNDGVEMNPDLEAIRLDLELENDWAVNDILNAVAEVSGKPIEGAEELQDLHVFLILAGHQLEAAPGYTLEGFREALATGMPVAVMPVVPVDGSGEDLTYRWEDFDGLRGIVFYESNPPLLEVAIWHFRLQMAFDFVKGEMLKQGQKPEEQMLERDMHNLVGFFDQFVMQAFRFYGTTSVLRSKQEKLDILREDNGDLLIPMPLKPEVEPVENLASLRQKAFSADTKMAPLQFTADEISDIWPNLRAHNYFCIRSHHGRLRLNEQAQIKVNSHHLEMVIDWTTADSLPGLYRRVHLRSLYELLTALQMVDPFPYFSGLLEYSGEGFDVSGFANMP